MELIRELGERIERSWRSEDYNEEALPSIASKALGEARIHGKISAWDVLEWAVGQNYLPQQRDLHASFGEPPITLFDSTRFHIDVYFWFEGTTAIHQHAFCGAFQVLHGSSLHSWYEFDPETTVNAFTEIGKLTLRSCNLLEVGDIQEIWAGRRYIHSLFHLEQPSATIVVRNHKSPAQLPQFAYFKPCLAIDPFYEEPNIVKRLQAVGALLRAKRPDADEVIAKMLTECDFQTCYSILFTVKNYLAHSPLESFFDLSGPGERFQKLLGATRERHGVLTDALESVFDYREKLDRIVAQRSYVTEPEHRFFLALLLNVEGRDLIFTLIRTRFPESDPLEKILDWVHELANTRVIGVNVPNALGVADFDDLDLIVLENILRGLSDRENIEALRAEFPDEQQEGLEKNVGERLERISNAAVFGPLLK